MREALIPWIIGWSRPPVAERRQVDERAWHARLAEQSEHLVSNGRLANANRSRDQQHRNRCRLPGSCGSHPATNMSDPAGPLHTGSRRALPLRFHYGHVGTIRG